jgi:hypothetical protein
MASYSANGAVKYQRKGEDGRGISEQFTYWAASAYGQTAPTVPSDPATPPSSSIWSTSAVSPTADKPYVWSYTRTHWSTGTAWTATTPCVTGMRSNNGTFQGGQLWSVYASTFTFLSGADGETSYHVVRHGGQYWKPTVTGTKAELGEPSASNTKWTLFDDLGYVSSKALITDGVYMMDESGNMVFRAEKGEVECKSGTFDNVTVRGEITAEVLNLGYGTDGTDKAALLNLLEVDGTLTFPALAEGASREYVLWFPMMTRVVSTVTLKGASSTVRFISDPAVNSSAASATIDCGRVARLIGVHPKGITYTYYIIV